MAPFWSPFPTYVTVAARRANAAAAAARLGKTKGVVLDPVRVSGRRITTSFWGKAWCENLQAYSDFASRLPRGRSYVRHGAVVHLEISAGRILAKVSGTELYDVQVTLRRLEPKRWKALVARCAGQIDSVVALLEGQLPEGVMAAVTDPSAGLFPSPPQIEMSCSCPDWAGMCKHVAATMYGVGARLDARPELLFVLRAVDHQALVHEAVARLGQSAGGTKVTTDDLGALFGIELAGDTAPSVARPGERPRKGRTAVRGPSSGA